MNKVFVSVIMPAYNAEKYIGEAISSILEQSYKNYEFIIVNDGSTDLTKDEILKFKDDRIVFINCETNNGNRIAANLALNKCKGEYIIRMDADDISLPNRIEKQVAFMEENPDVGFSGGNIELFGKANNIWNYAENYSEIRVAVLFGAIVVQGASIIRKKILDDYNLRYKETEPGYAEDILFFYQLFKVTKVGNIPDIVLRYRKHDTNTSSINWDIQREINSEVFSIILNDFGMPTDNESMKLHFWLNSRFTQDLQPENLAEIFEWKEKLIKQNTKSKWTDKSIFNSYVEAKWSRLFYICCDKGKLFYRSYSDTTPLDFKKKLYYFKKHIF